MKSRTSKTFCERGNRGERYFEFTTLSPRGRGWPAAGVFTSRGGTGEGVARERIENQFPETHYVSSIGPGFPATQGKGGRNEPRVAKRAISEPSPQRWRIDIRRKSVADVWVWINPAALVAGSHR